MKHVSEGEARWLPNTADRSARLRGRSGRQTPDANERPKTTSDPSDPLLTTHVDDDMRRLRSTRTSIADLNRLSSKEMTNQSLYGLDDDALAIRLVADRARDL